VDWYSNAMSLVPSNLYFSTNSPNYISKARIKGAVGGEFNAVYTPEVIDSVR
jgi:hypothetical protein